MAAITSPIPVNAGKTKKDEEALRRGFSAVYIIHKFHKVW